MEVKNAHERFLGYKKALKDHGLEFNEKWVKNCFDISEQEGFDFTGELMESADRPDAIFCITDLVALGAMNYLKSSGYQIPQQIGLMGFSNWMLSEYTSPSLSSVDQFGTQMGSKAAALLIDLLKKQELGANERLEVKTELVIRGSSMRS